MAEAQEESKEGAAELQGRALTFTTTPCRSIEVNGVSKKEELASLRPDVKCSGSLSESKSPQFRTSGLLSAAEYLRSETRALSWAADDPGRKWTLSGDFDKSLTR
jgi:hypothetical protein